MASCSSSLGAELASIKTNSVRSSPTPSVPTLRAASASSKPPMLATTSMCRPSWVWANSKAWRRSSSCLAFWRAMRIWIASISVEEALRRSLPRVPSKITGAPSGRSRVRASMPAMAGIPMERAKMATWEVDPPATVQNPLTRLGSMVAISEGVRSSASRMVFSG